MRRRREWFESTPEATLVLWWIEAGKLPDIEEAQARLDKLRAEGPSPEAFNFKHTFPQPGQ